MECRTPLGLIALMLPALALSADVSAAAPAPGATFQGEVLPLLKKYCIDCHGDRKPKAGLNLAAFTDEASVSKDRKAWSRVQENVESGEMPPEDRPQPSESEAKRLVGWVQEQLAKVDCGAEVDPGRVTLRRLNRAEYNNTVRDLVGVDFRPADDFPSDDVGYGFDNIGDVLTMPPILLEKYLAAAESIAERAIVAGPPAAKAPTTLWEAEDLTSAEGLVIAEGSRTLFNVGEIATTFAFPKDGEYLLRARAFGDQAGGEPARMSFRIDGEAVRTVDVPVTADAPTLYEVHARVRGGSHRFAVAFVNDFYDETVADPKRRDRNLSVDFLEIEGPVGSMAEVLPESHRRIIFRTPAQDRGDRYECARAILERFATRAYRRTVTPGEVARLVRFVDLAEQSGDSFERGIQLAVTAALTSPQFLFRIEYDPGRKKTAEPPATLSHPIKEFELASRLSYFLWSSMPDDELLALARDEKLRSGDTLERQVARMLRDPKARALVENFGDQWLQIRNLRTVAPDKARFPGFDDALRAAMLAETELFFESIVRDDRSVLDFLDADYTYLNERLARHYGIGGVKGAEFRRVALKPADRRGGILTQASVLTVTSNPTRTSPVKRGKWILEQILGTPPPPPPPDVPELKEQGPLSGTLRQQMEQHRADVNCATCHARMDPLGFGFENYDAVGAWRENDGGSAVDPSGTLPSGESFEGPAGLKAVLKAKDRDFVRCLAEKMLTFALGRGVEPSDQCVVDRMVAALAADGYKFSRLVSEIVRSEPFQRRKNRGA